MYFQHLQHFNCRSAMGRLSQRALHLKKARNARRLQAEAAGSNRELWSPNLRLDCRGKCLNNAQCCARSLLRNQPDFKKQKGLLEETIVAAGHKIIFYPKFHCELNFIENFWGEAKRHAHNNWDLSWKGLVETVPKSLASVSLPTIRRDAQRCFRYKDVYRKNLSSKAAENAVKKYRSHRKVPSSILMDVNVINANNK